MRMLMKVKVPTEAGNHALKDGILQKVFGEFAKQWNPEALYFIAEDGHRTAVTVFDMKDNSQMVQVAEPFFMAMNAEISWT
ncbi:MAG: hypothetical protein P4L58_01915, partial [Candidatus Pacebacteria bacterium]|nr:hypothetical protein [Candidatus Paceibacterota bacterium]